MYPGARRDFNSETRESPGSAGKTLSIGAMGPQGMTHDKTRGQQKSMPLQPKSVMVVHSTPSGEKIQSERYVTNVRL